MFLGRSLPSKKMRPSVGVVEAVDDVQHGGLAGAVGTDDGQDLARVDLQADIVQGLQTPEGDADVLRAEQGFPASHSWHTLSLKGLHVAESQVGLHGGGAAVLVGDLGFHVHALLTRRIEGLDEGAVFLGNEPPSAPFGSG